MRGIRWWIAAGIVLAMLVAGGLWWWFSESHAKSVKKYQSSSAVAWGKVSGDAAEVAATITRVATPQDLVEVSTEAKKMIGRIAEVTKDLEKVPVPSGYKETAAREKRALESIESYLEMLEELAVGGNAEEALAGRAILEDRARQAQDQANGFRSKAPWVKNGPQGDFFGAGQAIQSAFKPGDPALEGEAQKVYDTVKTFMNADIFQHDYDLLWSMISSRLHTGFEYFKVTKDRLMSGWASAWEKRPVNYFVSRSSIAFPGPENASVKVIAYVENGDPRIEELRLTKEAGSWKIDSYPFVGWL